MRACRIFASLLSVIACTQALADRLSPEQLRAIGHEAGRALQYGPKPGYPLEARARRFTGSGIFVIRVDIKTGRVVEAAIGRSTGHAILDQAALRAFRRWRFKAGALKPVAETNPELHWPPSPKENAMLQIPCAFTLSN